MTAVAATDTRVNAARKGLRRPARSLIAPRIGDTSALSSTEALTATVNHRIPGPSPRNRMLHRLIANDTTAKLKIVLAKS